MSFKFIEPSQGENHLLIALAGASGSGKTYSAMELAAGICGADPFCVIDTEAGRAKHYRKTFNFRHADFAPPFTPERYTEAVIAAEKAGFKAIVIDSMSHEFDGEGGIMEAAENSGTKGPGAWKAPKMRHKRMMNAFLQVRAHLIFCLRAEERIDMSKKDERGRVIVESAGWIPVQEKRFMYEMTASFTMTPQHPGVVDLSLPHKVQDQHRLAFLPGRHIAADAGVALDRWARGEEIEGPNKELWDRARRIAQDGVEQITTYFRTVATDEEKRQLEPIKRELWETAQRVDQNRGELE